MRIARRVTVHGKVQGVFYRDWTVKTARSLALGGWVRNETDGSVTAHLEGEEAAVRQMIESMRRGRPPPGCSGWKRPIPRRQVRRASRGVDTHKGVHKSSSVEDER